MKQPYIKSSIKLLEDGYTYFLRDGTTIHHEFGPAGVFINQEYYWFLKGIDFFKIEQ